MLRLRVAFAELLHREIRFLVTRFDPRIPVARPFKPLSLGRSQQACDRQFAEDANQTGKNCLSPPSAPPQRALYKLASRSRFVPNGRAM